MSGEEVDLYPSEEELDQLYPALVSREEEDIKRAWEIKVATRIQKVLKPLLIVAVGWLLYLVVPLVYEIVGDWRYETNKGFYLELHDCVEAPGCTLSMSRYKTYKEYREIYGPVTQD